MIRCCHTLTDGREMSLESNPIKESLASKERTFECKVYYEDTDCMGVVYHANYLRYLERARTEYLEDRLAGVVAYHERGYSFMVHKVEMVFHAPAKLGDQLVVRSWIENTTRFRIVVKQIIIKKGEPRDYLVTATITLVPVSVEGQLIQVPAEFHAL
jgi:acyl-CoA thioester hydrolase